MDNWPERPPLSSMTREALTIHSSFRKLLFWEAGHARNALGNYRLRVTLLTFRMRLQNKATAKSSKTTEVLVPDKLYFRIGEVSRLCELPAYVLRFWETEFPQLKPIKSGTGQRMYRRKDVENVLHIKKLLYEEGFTIVGARQQLRSEVKVNKKQSPLPFPIQPVPQLKYLRQGLHEILTMLSARHS